MAVGGFLPLLHGKSPGFAASILSLSLLVSCGGHSAPEKVTTHVDLGPLAMVEGHGFRISVPSSWDRVDPGVQSDVLADGFISGLPSS